MELQKNDARGLTKALGGRWHAGYGTAPCPACQPERRRDQNALTLSHGRDGRLLLHCKKSGCSFHDILRRAGLGSSGYTFQGLGLATSQKRKTDLANRARIADRLWREAVPATGTPAETYLRLRGITCALPPSLRYHHKCPHGPSRSKQPAMIAKVEGATGVAIHRTFLLADGRGKAGLPGGDKMMMATVMGGAVRLSRGGSRLVVCEGIETGLSLLCGLLDGPASVWAALSTSGMRNLRLPEKPGHLVIAPDGDRPGRTAAQVLAAQASVHGWRVSLLNAPDGQDWNDVLRARAAA